MPNRLRVTAAIAVLAAGASALPALAATPETHRLLVSLAPGRGALLPDAAGVRGVTQALAARGMHVEGRSGLLLKVSGPATAASLRSLAATGLPVTGVVDTADRTVRWSRRSSPVTGNDVLRAYDVPSAPLQPVAVPTVAPTTPVVATIQLSGWSDSDLTTYASNRATYSSPFDPVASGLYTAVGVDRSPAYDSNPVTGDMTGDTEVALDQEGLLAVAPQLRQRAYFATNTAAGLLGAYNAVLQDVAHGQPIVALSTSWGACESSNTASFVSSLESTLAQLNAAGVTVFAATGDAGRYDCAYPTDPMPTDFSTDAVDYPSSSPSVIGVGGTTHPNGGSAPAPDTVWNDPSSAQGLYKGDGSGGGVSATFGRPSWQSALSQGGTGRLVPDLSVVGDPGTGLNLVVRGADNNLVGGTSLSAPLAAGMLADLVAQHGTGSTARGVGDIHPVLYAHPAAFVDVTAATDTSTLVVQPPGPGYDESSGLGTPDWALLAPFLFRPAPSLSAPAFSRNPVVPLTLTAPSGTTATSWYVGTTDLSCSGSGTAAAPTSITLAEGASTVFARARLSDGACTNVASVRVQVDTHPPNAFVTKWVRTSPRSAVFSGQWAAADSGTGLGSLQVDVIRKATGLPVLTQQLAPAASTLTFTGVAGSAYLLRVTATDAAGNATTAQSPVIALPYDDRNGKASKGWKRIRESHSYLSTATVSGSKGATLTATVTGSTVGVLFAKGASSGVFQLIVDRRVVKTVDAGGPSRFLVPITVRVPGGRHTVVVKVLGKKGHGRGTAVAVDGFLAS